MTDREREVVRAQLAILAELDRRLARIPDELAPMIAAEPDLAKRREIIRREFARIADDLDETAAALFEKLTERVH